MSEARSPWDERYAVDEFFYGTDPNDFLAASAGLVAPGGRVLCLAEGEGRNAVFLAGLGHRVTAVDGSSVGLAKLAKLAASRGVKVETVHADLATFPIEPASWDAIVSIWCHVPPTLRRELHARCAAGLRAGGVLLLESYTPRQLAFRTGGPPNAELLMTAEGLRAELAGLAFERLEELDRDVHEGRGHSGRSAVVQVVARKT